jgi:hypothetical protein
MYTDIDWFDWIGRTMIGRKRQREEVTRTKFKKRKFELDTCPNSTRINFRLKILPKPRISKNQIKNENHKTARKKKKRILYRKIDSQEQKKEEKPATAKLSLKRNRDGTFKTGGNRKEELLKERQKLQEKLVSLQETMKETRKQFAEEIQKIKKEISTSTADFGTAKALEEEYSKLKNNPEG